jgi:hypothetical protein
VKSWSFSFTIRINRWPVSLIMDGSAPRVNSDFPLHEYQAVGLPLMWMRQGADDLDFYLGLI